MLIKRNWIDSVQKIETGERVFALYIFDNSMLSHDFLLVFGVSTNSFNGLYRLYYTYILVGNPPRPYYLDMDTGSDLTWIQCDAPCTSCAKVMSGQIQKYLGKIVKFDVLCEFEIKGLLSI